MKFLLLLLFLLPYSASDESIVEWIDPVEVDLGEIPLRQAVFIDFRYRNRSDEPLVIDNIRAECGCTAPDWSEEPILPDSLGLVRIEFTGRQAGYFRRPIKVFFDGQRKAERLYIEGEVVEN